MSYQHQVIGTIIASVIDYDALCNAINEPMARRNTVHANYVPCDGRSVNGSALGNSGVTNAPDLRGKFMRGLNNMYNHEAPPLDNTKADPDNARVAGSYQDDRVGKHTHQIATNDDGTSPDGSYKITAYSKHNGPSVTTAENENPHGETRPKNIAVYYFIKIN
jgi:hypothetical protein